MARGRTASRLDLDCTSSAIRADARFDRSGNRVRGRTHELGQTPSSRRCSSRVAARSSPPARQALDRPAPLPPDTDPAIVSFNKARPDMGWGRDENGCGQDREELANPDAARDPAGYAVQPRYRRVQVGGGRRRRADSDPAGFSPGGRAIRMWRRAHTCSVGARSSPAHLCCSSSSGISRSSPRPHSFTAAAASGACSSPARSA